MERSTAPPALLLLLLAVLTSLPLLLVGHPSQGSPSFRREVSLTPGRLAVDFIRDLNLVPGVPGAVEEEEQEADADAGAGRLVERKLRLEILGDSGSNISLEELGHHAGYYRLGHTHGARMFYFFFESRGHHDDPVVLWLTGGPGCSSELALFYENGPFSISNNMSLIWNDYGWDKASNIIFVDQPTGTGFSYTTDMRDFRFEEGGVSDDIYDFLQAFFEAHPNYLKNEFYVTGESYAGHYIPALAERIHKGNKEKQGPYINLKGFAIGNGLTNPAIQYGAYTDYALEMGIIKQDEYNKIKRIYPACELATKFCGSTGVASCLASLFICNSIFNSILAITRDMNYYDIRKKCEGSFCYDFSNMERFMNLKSVRDALGVGGRKFVSCNPFVFDAMLIDFMKNLEVGIPALIDDNIKVLVYAGEYDLICNWLGNSRWVESMEWSGHQQFAEASYTSFNVDGKEAGKLKSHGPLSFLKVHDAGHMVPMDQPKAALEMLKRWTRGKLDKGEEVVLADM